LRGAEFNAINRVRGVPQRPCQQLLKVGDVAQANADAPASAIGLQLQRVLFVVDRFDRQIVGLNVLGINSRCSEELDGRCQSLIVWLLRIVEADAPREDAEAKIYLIGRDLHLRGSGDVYRGRAAPAAATALSERAINDNERQGDGGDKKWTHGELHEGFVKVAQ